MEERTQNGVEEIDTNNLVEVKGYKKAKGSLLNKVLVGLGAILVATLVYANVNGINLFKREVEPEPEKEPTEAVAETKANTNQIKKSSGSNTNTNTNTNTNSAQAANQTSGNTTNNEGKGGPAEEKPAETQKPAETKTPEQIEESWTTVELPKEETITFGYYDAAQEREDKLSAADKEYIQEYVDYYGISYEDARVSYLQWGPLTVPSAEETPAPEQTQEVEYETRYVFDAEDEATIQLLMSELGYTRAEAENYYVTTIAPSLGKPIATEIVMLTK